MVQGNDMLRRNRKALLSDLSSLVKTAKKLQEYRLNTFTTQEPDNVNDTIDEMILKAFKIVTRGVRFLDAMEDGKRAHQLVNRTMATLAEECYNPLTPPADSTSFDNTVSGPNAGSRSISDRRLISGKSNLVAHDEQTRRLSYKRLSSVYSPTTKGPRRQSQVQSRRFSISHRISTTGPLLEAQRQNCISEVLSVSHDTLLSCLGSLIGRLHIHSSSSRDLLNNIRQAIAAGRNMLAIVESVCSYDLQSETSLQHVRDTMYQCINQLIIAARECVRPSSSDDEDSMPSDNSILKDAATDCVVAAGECVTRVKCVIERIGDFEMGPQGLGIIDVSTFGDSGIEIASSKEAEEVPPQPSNRPPPPPSVAEDDEKPLPRLPSPEEQVIEAPAPAPAEEATEATEIKIDTATTTKDILPPLPLLDSPLITQEGLSPLEHSQDGEFQCSSRSDSIVISSSVASSTYLSSMRDSESSMVSQTSTRATTPDLAPYVPSQEVASSQASITDSQVTMPDDMDDAECKMLEKTFAHELMFNKENQITGGSLPALIERLTTHDSTPDSIFVSTFYLTFRLFVTPVKLAEALVERFDYVADSPHIAGPVRLRVYNVFKGWIESHWRNLSDQEALPIIHTFAEEKLSVVLPAAGRRLLELSGKVSSTKGPLVPRLVSSMGKTNTSITQYVSPDTPLPSPVVSKSTANALKNWKMGGSSPSILDFDPLELARQLTIKEMNIFCSILPEELLASEWMKKSGSNAVNVRAMSTLSTDLSNLVADTILHHEDAKKRAVIIKHWIKIAIKCLDLNNYDSLMAIICSLNSSMITRLKKTWDMVSQKRKDNLKALQDIVEPTKNHAVLRQRLHDHVPPCLPFVGTYLTDLTFVDIGNPATKQMPGSGEESGLTVINFDKHTRTAKIIGELQRFQIPYRLVEVPEMQEWLQAQIVRVRCSNDQNNVQQFYRKSLLLEPRMASTKASPVESQSSFPPQPTKEKFDLFSWTRSQDKLAPPPINI
jgi:hypothetical protein